VQRWNEGRGCVRARGGTKKNHERFRLEHGERGREKQKVTERLSSERHRLSVGGLWSMVTRNARATKKRTSLLETTLRSVDARTQRVR
jgi:hypothetical protein